MGERQGASPLFTSFAKSQNEINQNKSSMSNSTTTTTTSTRIMNGSAVEAGGNSNNLLIVPPAVEPSFLYAPDKDILTGQPLIPRTPSPGPVSPRLHSPRPSSGLGGDPEPHTFSVNDSNEDFKFQSYHLDYKYTPPPIKGPCCVCGDGIMGAVRMRMIYF
jgi:hypothetical protein